MPGAKTIGGELTETILPTLTWLAFMLVVAGCATTKTTDVGSCFRIVRTRARFELPHLYEPVSSTGAAFRLVGDQWVEVERARAALMASVFADGKTVFFRGYKYRAAIFRCGEAVPVALPQCVVSPVIDPAGESLVCREAPRDPNEAFTLTRWKPNGELLSTRSFPLLPGKEPCFVADLFFSKNGDTVPTLSCASGHFVSDGHSWRRIDRDTSSGTLRDDVSLSNGLYQGRPSLGY
jgi:hypothetical protein